MKLIKRTTLLYQEGTSDKIYEVDLCQTAADSYVVKFRYGRRGSKLKEGVKTAQPVVLDQAQQVFDKLVSSKTKKGYRDISTQPEPVPAAPALDSGEARKQAILSRLAGRGNSKWPLSRAIWRAGELQISEATPLMLPLIGKSDALTDYCIAWALGCCGGEGALSALHGLMEKTSTPEFVSRIAWEAIVKLSDSQTRAELQSRQIAMLPEQLRDYARNGSSASLSAALESYLDGGDYQKFAVLDTLYKIDNQHSRPALLNILRTAPLRPNYFQRIRHIFKMAEYRHDGEVYGIIAYRFERERGMYRSNYWGARIPGVGYLRTYEYSYSEETGRYERLESNEFQEEMQRPDTRIAYSDYTREYLRRRVWRTLKQLGEDGSEDYVQMAAGILLTYSDDDAEAVRESIVYRWDRSSRTRTHRRRDWDAYAGYLTFNHILYENSPRYVHMPNSRGWRCREGYQPGGPEPDGREEAFPELWEADPEAVLQLLLASNCRPVHHFAVKVLAVCQQFCATIDVDTSIALVNKPYEVTAQLGFQLVRAQYDPDNPNMELLLALANCLYSPARSQAHEWISASPDRILSNAGAIASLVTSQHGDTRTFARGLLSGAAIGENTAKVAIGQIIARVLGLKEGETELAREIGQILVACFGQQLRKLGLGVILDLLSHPMPEIQAIGAEILLNHETPAAELPPELIESLLSSPYESVRSMGIGLFGQLPDETLMGEQRVVIVAMAVSPESSIREAILPIIRRLATEHPAFGTQLAGEFIELLQVPERHEGVHSYLVSLLGDFPSEWMSGVTKETALQLLRAKSSAAQELGGLILNADRSIWTDEFATPEVVKLASHEILAVREAARAMFAERLDRIRRDPEEKLAGVRLLESKWEDTRQFALETFTNSFSNEDWTPEVMISICDSIREEVRQYGRDLVTRHFQASNGEEYLVKFSEHPSADMQLFATNYLESYAVDNPDRLEQLMPYFISILCGVNRGRVAKKRIFAFLEAEALKSEAAAKVVAEIMTRQSVTIAIGDKAAAIGTMLKIHKRYPHIPLPLQVKPVVCR